MPTMGIQVEVIKRWREGGHRGPMTPAQLKTKAKTRKKRKK